MIDDKHKDNIAMNGVSYLFHYFSPSSCEITSSAKRFYKQVMSYGANENSAVASFSHPLVIC